MSSRSRMRRLAAASALLAGSVSTVWAVGSFQSGSEKALALHCC